MKKSLDKLSKINLCTIVLLLLATTTIKDDSSFIKSNNTIVKMNLGSNKIVAIQPPIAQTNIDDSKVIVIQEPVKETTADQHKNRTSSLSRGGSITERPQSEHDVINSYVRDVTSRYNIQPELIMSIIYQESRYNTQVRNGNCLGLMQVSSYWHRERAIKLGVTNFYDPYSNILVGVDYISELHNKYKDIYLVLMVYNMGDNVALQLYRNGHITDYARTIVDRAEIYKKGE